MTVMIAIALPVWAGQREKVCLNGIWLIHSGGSSDSVPADTWTYVRVPNKQSGWYLEESDIALGVEEGTAAWYKTGFIIPAGWDDGRLIGLRFEGINHYGKVFVNGRFVGEHRFVYVPYEVDITEMARPGQVNELAVCVADVHAPGMAEDFIGQLKWRSYVLRNGGLIGDVFLISCPRVYVSDVFIVPSYRKMELSARISLTNQSNHNQQVMLYSGAFLGSAKKLAMPKKRVAVPAGATVTVELSQPWQDPTLWGYGKYGSPTLYEFKTHIVAANITDTHFDRFGFREFWCEGNEFRLNGKKIFLTGDCVSMVKAFSYPNNRQYINMAMQAMREMNCNNLRLGWEPRPGVWFDVADEVGMTLEVNVHNDVPVYGYDEPIDRPNEACVDCVVGERAELTEQMIREYMRAHRNHPSIIIWESNNEVGCQGDFGADPRGWQGLANIQAICREEDPSRPVDHQGSARITLAPKFGIDFEPDIWNVHPYGRPLMNDVERITRLFNFRDDRPQIIGEVSYNSNIIWGLPGITPEQRKQAYRLYSAMAEHWAESALDYHKLGGDGIQMLSLAGFALNGPKTETEFEGGPWGFGLVEVAKSDGHPVGHRHDLAVRAEGPDIIEAKVTWPADSGEDIKVSGLGWGAAAAYSNINWWDPTRKPYGINIVGEKVTQAYAEVSGGNLPPLPRKRRPELIVIITLRDQPVPDRYVRVSPAEGQAVSAQMVRTDPQGRAWFVLPMPGRYNVSLGNLAATTVDVHWAERSKKAGYEFLQYCRLDLPTSASGALVEPLNRPDTDRERFMELVREARAEQAAAAAARPRPQPKPEHKLMATRPIRLEYALHRAPPIVTVDGDGEEWAGYPAIELGNADELVKWNMLAENWQGPEDLSAVVKVAWDEESLYLYALVRDDQARVMQPGAAIHEGDGVELFVGFSGPSDAQVYGQDDFQIVLNAGSTALMPRIVVSGLSVRQEVGAQIAVVDTQRPAGYALEARLPLSSLGQPTLSVGQLLGFGVALNDADDPVLLRESKLDWASDIDDNAYRWPAVWNQARVSLVP
ncbi:MAG: hypothetical protein KAW89_05830 [Armatimonadetes bacterium]|nr:hypothetical protein [Armatimonadota bacterium]